MGHQLPEVGILAFFIGQLSQDLEENLVYHDVQEVLAD